VTLFCWILCPHDGDYSQYGLLGYNMHSLERTRRFGGTHRLYFKVRWVSQTRNQQKGEASLARLSACFSWLPRLSKWKEYFSETSECLRSTQRYNREDCTLLIVFCIQHSSRIHTPVRYANILTQDFFSITLSSQVMTRPGFVNGHSELLGHNTAGRHSAAKRLYVQYVHVCVYACMYVGRYVQQCVRVN
jgi:hypothetical protein